MTNTSVLHLYVNVKTVWLKNKDNSTNLNSISSQISKILYIVQSFITITNCEVEKGFIFLRRSKMNFIKSIMLNALLTIIQFIILFKLIVNKREYLNDENITKFTTRKQKKYAYYVLHTKNCFQHARLPSRAHVWP